MDEIGLNKTTSAGWAILIAGMCALLAATAVLAKGGALSKALAVVTGLLTGAITTICWRGGQE